MPALKDLLLAEPRLTLSAAESLTSGHVQASIGAVSGASEYFLGGITAYSLEQKVRHLGVDRASARRVNCVSAEVARQMARGACALFGSDIAVATTGYAERAALRGVSGPFAWWALAHRGRNGDEFIAVRTGRVECPGAKRAEVQHIVAEVVLTELEAYLRAWRAK